MTTTATATGPAALMRDALVTLRLWASDAGRGREVALIDAALAADPAAALRVKVAGVTLTPRQFEVLSFIDAYIRENGFAPTLVEIAGEWGVSKVTAYEHVDELVKKGVLERTPNVARGLRILECKR